MVSYILGMEVPGRKPSLRGKFISVHVDAVKVSLFCGPVFYFK